MAQTKKIAALLQKNFGDSKSFTDNGFEFLEKYYLPLENDRETYKSETNNLCMVYPYFALYGDILTNETTDHLPDRLLSEYAKCGINGIWLQGILYQLVEFPFDPSLSKGWEVRICTLKKLVSKAKKFGIGVYLYLNEPRSMPESFFEKYPDLKGAREDDFFAMCTSKPEVKDYLYKGVKHLFENVPDLAGFFSISMSENLTNCYSRTSGSPTECPHCKERLPWEVLAEVNNLMAKGAHDAVPSAKTIVWTWGWPDDWANKAIELLCEGQIVQSCSEEGVTFCRGGIKGSVSDYSMSVLGPGEYAKGIWKTVRKQKLEGSAKIQVSTTWEMAAVPYLPVLDLVEKHIENLKREGVKHLHASWTLGGFPSPNIKLVTWLMQEKGTCEEFFIDWLGCENGRKVYQAQKQLCGAFSNFPFHIHVLYFGPHNFGPMAPFFLKKTGYEATMVGYPYDDLEKWSSIYPVEIYEKLSENLCLEWKKGLKMLADCRCESEETEDLYRIAAATLCHFKSALHHIQFVRNRDNNHTDALLHIICEETENIKELIGLRTKDSRIGYESSNHYFYTLQDLKEKFINLEYCKTKLLKRKNQADAI